MIDTESRVKNISKADKAEDRWTILMFFLHDTMTLTHGSNLLRLYETHESAPAHPESLRSGQGQQQIAHGTTTCEYCECMLLLLVRLLLVLLMLLRLVLLL